MPRKAKHARRPAPAKKHGIRRYASGGALESSASMAERTVVVVANAAQRERLKTLKRYAKRSMLIVTAPDVERIGCQYGFRIADVEYKPGWALECDRPEIVVERLNARVAANRGSGQ